MKKLKNKGRLLRQSPADWDMDSPEVLDALQSLVTEIRLQPGDFRDVRSIATQSGLTTARVADLFCRHYHATPYDVLKRARLEAAKRLLLTSELSVGHIAQLLSHQSVDGFEREFLACNGLLSEAYRKLGADRVFAIQLPVDYPLGYLRKALGRDKHSVTERLLGDDYTTAIRLGEEALLVNLTLGERCVHVRIAQSTTHAPRVHAMVVGLLGLDQNTSEFTGLVKRLGLESLVQGRANLEISQTHSIFDGMLWTIIGQQINIPFACMLKRRLIELTGTPMADGFFAPPTPQTLAAIDPAELLPLQFSRQKVDYVVSTARLVADGKLDLESLRTMPATRARETLLAVRGLGPWSVNYLMMRSLGFADCLPLGDTGVTGGLRSLFGLKQKPDAKKVLSLTEQFSPFRSLATAHLWQFSQPTLD